MKLNLKKTFIIATFFALVVRGFVIENFRIASNSMTPNYPVNTWVFANKLAYSIRIPFSHYVIFNLGTPKAGEVVVFSVPEKGNDSYIKRIVATEDQTVQIKEGKVFINNKVLINEQGTEYNINAHYKIENYENLKDFGPVVVPARHFFALGDNRADSIDSRIWGPIPNSYLKGRVN
jgi:signal peptidase I